MALSKAVYKIEVIGEADPETTRPIIERLGPIAARTIERTVITVLGKPVGPGGDVKVTFQGFEEA